MSFKRLLPKLPRRLSAQVVYVFLAFAVMTICCYFYVGNMERDRLTQDAKTALSSTNANITAELRERATALDAVAETARIMVLRGDTYEMVQGYFQSLTDYMLSDGAELLPYVTGFYGAFDAFDNRLLSGSGWDPPDGYDATQRPWYTAATDDGEVRFSDPYFDMAQESDTISYSRRLLDNRGNSLGVVCLSLKLVRARGYAAGLELADGGYGMLLNQSFEIISHSDPDLIDQTILSVNSDMRPLSYELRETGSIDGTEFENYRGEPCVAFFDQLDIGWYAGVIIPKSAYYNSTLPLLRFLIGISSALAVILSAVLLRLIALKARADDRARIMFEVLPLSTNLIDTEGHVLDCNQETLNLFGVEKKDDYLLHFFRFSPEKQPNGLRSRELAAEYIRMAFDQGRCRFEWLHQNAAGDPIPCEVTLIRVELDGVPLVSGNVHDLRELKAAAEKLREADERTQIMLDATPLCCCLIDKKLRIIDCNEEAVNLFGLSDKSEFIRRFFELMPESQPSGASSLAEIRKNMALAFEQGEYRTEFLHQTPAGEAIPTEVVLVRVKSKDDIIIAGYIRDLRQMKAMIREMHRIEIAEESNKAKSKFIATMSHEMRTPLNAILGITEIQLMDETLPYGSHEAFSLIFNSSHTLLHIINDILNLSRIEAGKVELLPVKYDMASLLNDAAQLNLMQRGSKPIEFRLDVNTNTPSVLFGDELRIKQILGNLLSNAFKYTEKGLVTLSVSSESEENRADVIVIFRVTDTGIGMTVEQTETIFDAYSRFTTEYTRSSEGTGLGMNITQNLVHMMGGSIDVRSEKGKGTEFTVRLPQIRVGSDVLGYETVQNLQQFRINASASLKKNTFTREYMPYGHVLIVDDVESNAYVARGLMAPYGLSIETVMSGYDALDLIRAGHVYDIVFMDHMMPKMDGIETTKNLRDMGYDRPIVALTANAVAGQQEFFLGHGFDGFISKPIDTRQLNDVLNKLIRDKYPHETIEAARKQKLLIDTQSARKTVSTEVDPELARIFARDAHKAADTLNAICAQNGGYSEEDLNLYVINVHAMKSALASIGQPTLSSFALRLEETVRGRDISVIQTETPAFIEKLLELAEELTKDEPKDTGKPEDTALLREKLAVIAEACANYDKKPAKNALSELRKKAWSAETNELLDIIAEHLLHSSFEDAGILAEDALELLQK